MPPKRVKTEDDFIDDVRCFFSFGSPSSPRADFPFDLDRTTLKKRSIPSFLPPLALYLS
jgi:hypothetical protein